MTEQDPDLRIKTAMAETPTAALEDIARAAGTNVASVLRALPEGEAHCIPGAHFVSVMDSFGDWGDMTLIVNTGNVILEAKGQVTGSVGRGFYNLGGKAVGGHLKFDACDMIAFVSRKLFGSDTHSIQFYDTKGDCMFKIYLGRDADRKLIPSQVQNYH
ncbi:MAG: heme utilization cystosolic carrier protein HutX, partial [Pseudorhodobacter sp.]